MSKLETNQVDPATGTTLTLGTSGDTITIPSGVTIANSGTATGFGGITMADSWKIANSQNISADTDTVVNAGWTRNSTEYSQIGTGLTESSGVFISLNLNLSY